MQLHLVFIKVDPIRQEQEVILLLDSVLNVLDPCRFFFIFCTMNQQMHNYLTNYYTAPTCFDAIVSSSGSS
jgi:hypothetical protein